MCEILFKAIDAVHPNPEKDARGSYKAGDPVVVMPDGHTWGNGEVPPAFIIVKVPGLDPDTVKARIDEQWLFALDYNVVSSDSTLDAYRIEVFCDPQYVKGDGTNAVTRAQIETWLNGWNATFVSALQNAIRFDLTIFGLLTSPRMFNAPDVTGVIFSEVYNQAARTHSITMDWSAKPWSQADVVSRLTNMVILNDQAGLTEFRATRADAVSVFKAALQQRFQSTVRRRRWHISAANVAAALAAGGIVTITQAQLTARLLDKVQE